MEIIMNYHDSTLKNLHDCSCLKWIIPACPSYLHMNCTKVRALLHLKHFLILLWCSNSQSKPSPFCTIMSSAAFCLLLAAFIHQSCTVLISPLGVSVCENKAVPLQKCFTEVDRISVIPEYNE